MVLVHDDDLAKIVEICNGTVSEQFEEGDVVHYVFAVTGSVRLGNVLSGFWRASYQWG